MKPKINLLFLSNCFIYNQLEIEEALLRSNDENWCIVNTGSKEAIVMGISSDAFDFVHLDQLKDKQIPVIKRFSGGGTVFVDHHTFFVSFIFQKKALNITPYPEPILLWGESFYKNLFNHSDFHLAENDYALGEKKIGGNALYIRKDRWLLHTSFLWDYQKSNMDLLKMPKKIPSYRQNREHQDFVTKLKEYYPSLDSLIERLHLNLKNQFNIQNSYTQIPKSYLEKEYRKSLTITYHT